MRTAFLQTLEEMASQDERIYFVTGDLGFSVIEPFREKFPRRFLNAGVAEQNMTGVAAGMALSGKIVFTYSIANFPTLRCLEQIRNDGAYHEANLKVVSVGGGFAYGALGSSHHATEDLAVLRAIPGMTVLSPADPLEAEHATRAAATTDGPFYLRLGKAGEQRVHPGPIDFRIGKAIRVREGSDLTVIATGSILKACVEACAALEVDGISARLLSMHTIKPIDAAAIAEAAEQTGAIVTVEEHSVIGGLGSAVAEVLAQHPGRRPPLKILGLPDRFCRDVGGQSYLLKRNRLTAEGIARAAAAVHRDPIDATGVKP
ncbi:MAG: transketolase [Elusimicrobia bacterium CG_4_9_14_3_um_filter_62_55]|nr:MAG: transketolase [Elusimicrobia bacterium CG22_combo_CG10-13_8_21_14_all_63_91]PJB24383.1 MAG: transketolase [Elusimicrobia bacterium CG_4_9_14_3_um_filter_62_55]